MSFDDIIKEQTAEVLRGEIRADYASNIKNSLSDSEFLITLSNSLFHRVSEHLSWPYYFLVPSFFCKKNIIKTKLKVAANLLLTVISKKYVPLCFETD